MLDGVLAFPRGETTGRIYDDGTWTSTEAEGLWTLSLENDKERTIHLEASMSTLAQPFDVCGVSLDGTALLDDDWSYDVGTGVLDVSYTTTSGTLTVTAC